MPADPWLAGDHYEPFMGRWSRLVAPRFLDWLGCPAGLRWVDVGCGTGALSHAIAALAEPSSVLGVDPSPGFVAYAGARATDPRASFEVGTADDLAPASADVVVSGLVLNFIPDPTSAVTAMAAAAGGGSVAGGGTVAAYLWDYAGGMQMLSSFWDAAVELDPAAQSQHEATRFPDWGQSRLVELATGAGLDDVETTTLTVSSTYAGVGEVWAPFLGGTGPAPGYVASLNDEDRESLRARWVASLPVAEDGSVELTARAFAVRGHA